jgi:subfamily B ATP-binding cassette protein MsbA
MRDLWRLLGYLKPYVGRMTLAAVLLAMSGALMAAVVSTVKPLVNQVLLPGVFSGPVTAERAPEVGGDILSAVRDWLPVESLSRWLGEHAFVQVPLLIIAIFFVRGVFLYIGQYLTIKSGAMLIRDLREELYSAVTFQSLPFFQAHPTGLILSRILNDVQRVQRMTTMQLADLVRVSAMVPFLLLTALYHDWRMSLVTLVMLPLLGYPMINLGKKMRRASTASQENLALVASRLTESITGVKVVQGFGMEHYEIGRFREALRLMLRADLRAGRARSLAPSVMELLGAVVGAALFYLAGFYIARGRLDPGNFTVVLLCLGMLFMSIRRLNAVYSEMQNALAAATRVFEMLDREREIADQPGASPLPAFSEEIRFDRVGFSYGDEQVLRDIELTIARGETVALVGPSGSGKSTLANLLPRFYDPTSGRILVDGQNIREVTLESLRGQIGLVTQETVLFDDTVRNNIAYGREEVPLDRVIDSAQDSQAHEFIEQLPRGYDTALGERGTRLSMGQRQRITIARALLKDPPLLILDEATSALDAESEVLVQRALERLMQGRTSIVIAHRLATVRNADRILVLERGQIVEQGTHQALLARAGVYARLYELQFKESAS